MTKKLLTLGILAIILGGIFILYPTNVFGQTDAFTECVKSGQPPESCASNNTTGNEVSFTDFIFGSFFDPLVKGIGYTLMTLSAGILTMVGSLFDFIVEYTIIDMAKNIGDPEGVGGSISAAWRTLRDIANMLFIFVLLYVAFKSMFELDFGSVGKSVKNIIIVALLINFSLFFSKVVIDASNIVSVGFYNSIITANTRSVGTGEGSTGTTGTQTISTGYMRLLGLQSWYSPNILIAPKSMTTQKLLIVGVFSSVFMLITAVVLLISAVMFVARFIILVFLMILSPLALIAIIIPEQGGKFEQWKKALIDQAFFAPVFFALTWVVFKVASTPGFLGQLGASSVAGANAAYIDLITKAPTSSMGLVLNYVLVIGFAIAALVISKQIATRTAGFSAISGGLGINKATGLVGGVAFGGTAALGRRTIGATASRLAQSNALSNWAGKSWIGQKVKEGTEGVAKSSFDVRQTKTIGGALQNVPGVGSFGTGKTGGYDATLQGQIAQKEKVASGLKSDQARRDFAARQVSGLATLYARGGSRPWNKRSLLGTMGRGNRIVAAKILGNQLTQLNSQRDILQNRENSLTQQLSSMNNEQATLQATNNPNPAQVARLAALNAPMINPATGAPNRTSIAYVQDQLTNVQTQFTNINDQINHPVTGIQTQINNLGITNPSNPIVNPVTGSSRPARADEQNY